VVKQIVPDKTSVVKSPPEKTTSKLRIQATRYPFVDLVKDMTIGFDPVEVEMHPWLQLQVDAGHLTIVE